MNILPQSRSTFTKLSVCAIRRRDKIVAGLGGDDIDEVVAGLLEVEGRREASPRCLCPAKSVRRASLGAEEDAGSEEGLNADLERSGRNEFVESRFAGGGEVTLDSVADDVGEDEAENARIGAGGLGDDGGKFGKGSVREEAERWVLEREDANFFEVGSSGGLDCPALSCWKFLNSKSLMLERL